MPFLHGNMELRGRAVPRVVDDEGVLALRAPVLGLRPLGTGDGGWGGLLTSISSGCM